MNNDLDRLDATTLLARLGGGHLDKELLAEHFIHKVESDEHQVHAFAQFDAERVRAQFRQTRGRLAGPLAGLVVGVKDNIATAEYPTEYHSPIYRRHQPARDAFVVARLRQAGAIVMGKTHTTEFAYMHTGPTCNPHDRLRTPGSSSAGSAAGMAAGFFPLALGTQTAGSLIKPAAYCGAFAYKPSFGLVSLEGVKPLAPSFDTLGWFGRSVADLELLARVLVPGLPSPGAMKGVYGFCRTTRGEQVAAEVAVAVDCAIDRLRSTGLQIRELRLPAAFDTVFEDHLLINDCEGARSFACEAQAAPHLLSDSFSAMLDRAANTSWRQESAARQRIADLAPVLRTLMQPFDALVGYSCGQVAPLGLGATGPSDFIKCWMAFGLPQLNIPLPVRAGQLPIGLQVIGSFREDAQLLWAATQISGELNNAASVP